MYTIGSYSVMLKWTQDKPYQKGVMLSYQKVIKVCHAERDTLLDMTT